MDIQEIIENFALLDEWDDREIRVEDGGVMQWSAGDEGLVVHEVSTPRYQGTGLRLIRGGREA